MQVRHGFHRFKPVVHILKDGEEKARVMRWYVRKHPGAAGRLFGWDRGRDDPEGDALRRFAVSLPIIRLGKPCTRDTI